MSEAKWTRLRLEGYTGTLPDMFMAFLVAEGFTEGAMQDRELLWLQSLGATATNLGDAWGQVLVADGYIGARPESEILFWINHVF